MVTPDDEDEEDEFISRPVFTYDDAINEMNRAELLLDHPERILDPEWDEEDEEGST